MEGGDQNVFYKACEGMVSGRLQMDKTDADIGTSCRDRVWACVRVILGCGNFHTADLFAPAPGPLLHPEWFMDAVFSAMDFEAFFRIMTVKAEARMKRLAK